MRVLSREPSSKNDPAARGVYLDVERLKCNQRREIPGKPVDRLDHDLAYLRMTPKVPHERVKVLVFLAN